MRQAAYIRDFLAADEGDRDHGGVSGGEVETSAELAAACDGDGDGDKHVRSGATAQSPPPPLASLTSLPTLISLRIKLLHKGTLGEADSIHLPSRADLAAWASALRAVGAEDAAAAAPASLLASVEEEPVLLECTLWDAIKKASTRSARRESPLVSSASASAAAASKTGTAPPLPRPILETKRQPQYQDGHISLALFYERLLDPVLSRHPPSRRLIGFATSSVNTHTVRGLESASVGVAFVRAEALLHAVRSSSALVAALTGGGGGGADDASRQGGPAHTWRRQRRGEGACCLVLVRKPTSLLYRPALLTLDDEEDSS